MKDEGVTGELFHIAYNLWLKENRKLCLNAVTDNAKYTNLPNASCLVLLVKLKNLLGFSLLEFRAQKCALIFYREQKRARTDLA